MNEHTTTERVQTAAGPDQVDLVLASLETLGELPVGEHVAVFEQAHDRLRRALDAAGPAASPIPDQLRPQR